MGYFAGLFCRALFTPSPCLARALVLAHLTTPQPPPVPPDVFSTSVLLAHHQPPGLQTAGVVFVGQVGEGMGADPLAPWRIRAVCVCAWLCVCVYARARARLRALAP